MLEHRRESGVMQAVGKPSASSRAPELTISIPQLHHNSQALASFIFIYHFFPKEGSPFGGRQIRGERM